MSSIRPEVTGRTVGKVTSREPIGTLFVEMDPNEIVRTKDGKKVFGLGPTQIAKKIKLGEIPPPIKLSESGRASGWTGCQINDYRRQQAERIEATPPASAAKTRGGK
ncbi:putative DNA-binding transcriptional regulator AlpA [Bradyrhizobium sp. USDA 4463]